jgi:Zinc carboxypeptidase
MLDEIDEIDALLGLAERSGVALRCRTVCRVHHAGTDYPVQVLTLGNPAPGHAAVGFFGGVHGLERIGAQVVLAGLRSLILRLPWDTTLQHLLAHLHLIFMPVVNPGGMARGTRANPQGVDLMRNAPIDCEAGAAAMVGGQRIGPGLPWYRGAAGAPMQPEAQALCDVVTAELLPHPLAISLDCHSGFGLADRLWFPYAHTPRPMTHLAELAALARLLDDGLLHHRYLIEPQSRMYLTHGDLWDHLHRTAQAVSDRVFLPLTLEMGSWLWVRKNPRQAFSRRGLFNPLILHRQQRVLRRHLALMDFLMRAAASHRHWLPGADARAALHHQGLDRWYRRPR